MAHSIAQKIVPAKLSEGDVAAFRAALLGWYDRHARLLPWRALPGRLANPYHVWLSEIMLQQTTVAAVTDYFRRFIEKWPTVRALAAAPAEEVMAAWAGLGYYARARNLLLCAQIVAAGQGGFPANETALLALPGIGPYTAAAIAAIAFGRPATVVDGNVERVVARWFGVETPLPTAKPLLRELAGCLMGNHAERPGDFAQGLMDLGATICTPRAPRCGDCPLAATCRARLLGVQAELPRRLPKKSKPLRRGEVYWIANPQGDILLETRPARGLLGGMPGLPTSSWLEGAAALPAGSAPLPDWLNGAVRLTAPGEQVRHVFTHFTLDLTIVSLRPDRLTLANGQYWTPADALADVGLPTLFGKCARAMLTWIGG